MRHKKDVETPIKDTETQMKDVSTQIKDTETQLRTLRKLEAKHSPLSWTVLI